MSATPELDIYEPTQYVAGVPFAKLDRLRAEDPVHWHELPDGGGAWYLLAHADVVAASKDHKTFSAARGGIVVEQQSAEALEMSRTQLLSMDPPEHKELRNLVFDVFRPSTIDAMEQWLREQARAIMDRAAAMGECDFVVDVAGELPMQTINQMMEIPPEDRTRIVELSDRIIASGGTGTGSKTRIPVGRSVPMASRSRASGWARGATTSSPC